MDSRFVRVYDNSLSPEICNELINQFTIRDVCRGHNHYDTPVKRFEQWSLRDDLDKPEVQELWNHVTGVGTKITQHYLEKCRIPEIGRPKRTDLWEPLRMKRYPAGEGHFHLHTDSSHYGSVKRWLAFFWYLNDVEEGGETIFEFGDGEEEGRIEAKQGRCVVFPPFWTYPHRGAMPISDDKYFIGTYLHHEFPDHWK